MGFGGEKSSRDKEAVWLLRDTHGAQAIQRSTGGSVSISEAMPRFLAHYGQAAWQDGSWENAVPRVSRDVANRVDRLRGLGNGQVPAVAALAWETLR